MVIAFEIALLNRLTRSADGPCRWHSSTGISDHPAITEQ